MLFVLFNFSVTILINNELDKSNFPTEKLKNIRTFNNIIQLTSLVFITIVLTSFVTRRLGCRERTSGKNFALLAQIGLFIFAIVVMVLSIMCFIDENFSLLQSTNVKMWLIVQITITSLLILFGFYQLYQILSKKSSSGKDNKSELKKFDW
jgi:magnesium-transporting ATPase (P-type)